MFNEIGSLCKFIRFSVQRKRFIVAVPDNFGGVVAEELMVDVVSVVVVVVGDHLGRF